jgi:ribonuclease HI
MKKSNFDRIVVFADGACSGNPGRGGWGSIVVTPKGEVTELGAGAPETTNNRMEILAVIKALEYIEGVAGEVAIHSDSSYLIRGITEWIWAWKNRGWKTAAGDDVANQDLWEWLSKLVQARKAKGEISWHYVRGHSGIPGNERVDEIAVEFTAGRRPHLFEGSLLEYDVAIHDIPEDTSLPEMKERVAKPKAFSYLSLVDGKVRRHQTWAECERLVNGRSGAKFKKSISQQDEATILKSWGKSQSDISE